MELKQLVEKKLAEIIKIRRQIHMNPELGFEEFKTTDLITKTLDELSIPWSYAWKGKTGVIANIKGITPGKTILLKTDIDALEIQEETQLDYKSKNDGKMHACGHDGHTASLLGVAMVLKELNFNFPGEVRLLFEPAEEGPEEGGICKILKENKKFLMNNVSAALAYHLQPEMNYGTIRANTGEIHAHFIDFDIEITGAGAHAAKPHLAGDPITMAAQLVIDFNTFISKHVNPFDIALINITKINSGKNYGVVPANLKMGGTIRLFNMKLVPQIKKYMTDSISLRKLTNNLDAKIIFMDGYPSLQNDKIMVDLVLKTAIDLYGKNRIDYSNGATLGAEDFSYISRLVPSAYFDLGIKKGSKKFYGIHNSKFCWDDNILLDATVLMSQITLNFLNKK